MDSLGPISLNIFPEEDTRTFHLIGEPIPMWDTFSKSTQSFGDFRGMLAVGRFNSQLSHLSKIPFESLSPLPGRPT